jgi:DNA-binding transcriptional MerR regulator
LIMADETQPAVTPAATENQGGNESKTFSQADLDEIVKERLGRDRRAREEAMAKELGMPLKDVKAIIQAKKEADEAQKSELERLTGERDAHKTAAERAVLEAAKVRALAKAGAEPDKIDTLLKRVVGSTPGEIEADVAELKELGLIGAKLLPQTQRAGGASNPANPVGEETTLDEQIRALESQALKTGNQRDWAAVNRLKARKYQK